MKQAEVFPGWRVFGAGADLQAHFDAAVVMPTIGRAQVLDAVASVYRQSGVGRIQLLIGVDKPIGDVAALIQLLERAPAHVTPCLFHPGYSTSVRHGGLHPAQDGGVLRCTLTFLANARLVAYLDDDNWWDEGHLRGLIAAIRGKAWAFSLRWFVHPQTRRPVCVDEWESVGPGRGVFTDKFGGFVDPNCLMIDKLVCWQCPLLWNVPLPGDARGMSADRHVFNFLRQHSAPGESGKATAFYALDPTDALHPMRVQHAGERYDRAGAQPASSP